MARRGTWSRYLRRLSLGHLAATVLAMATVPSAIAQVSVERQLQQIQRETYALIDSDIPADQRALLDYGGFLTFNFFAVDDAAQNTNSLAQTDLNGYVRASFDGVHEFFVRGRTSYRHQETQGVARMFRDDHWVQPRLDRATYQFNLRQYLAAYEGKSTSNNFVLRGGRDFHHLSNGLTLSEELDGATTTFVLPPLTFDVLGGMTSDNVDDFDGTRPNFSEDGETDRLFVGGRVTMHSNPRHRPFVYGVVQRDLNPDETLVSPGGIVTQFDYNSWYIGAGSAGSFVDSLVYGFEFVYQGGHGLSNSFDPNTFLPIVQTEEPISAFAMDLRLDYLLNDANRTRLGAEFLLATGDSDRLHPSTTFGGNTSGTPDHSFNGFGFINTGICFNPRPSNLVMFRLGAATFPLPASRCFRRLQVGVNVFIYSKHTATGAISEPTTDDPFLGWEPDLFANWQITSDLSMAVRYGVFFPGTAIVADSDPRHFLFTGVTLAF